MLPGFERMLSMISENITRSHNEYKILGHMGSILGQFVKFKVF